jgi:hypothetical protein
VSVPPRICLSLIASIRLAVPAASKSDSYAGIATVPRLDRPERTSSGDPRRSSQERRTSAALHRSARVARGGSRSPHERRRCGVRGSGEGA